MGALIWGDVILEDVAVGIVKNAPYEEGNRKQHQCC